MIQINLLPKELRRAEPTPWPKLLALLVSLIVILSVALVMIYYRYNLLPTVLDERNRLEEKKKTLEDLAKDADRLEQEIKDFKLRAKTIIDIRQTRWLWARKLDQIVDIIPKYIRITSFTVTEARGTTRSRAKEGPKIEMDCISATADERNISKFRRGIINSSLWDDILDMPEWAYQLEKDKENDQEVLKFKAVLVLKPKEPPKPKPPPRPPPRPAKPARG